MLNTLYDIIILEVSTIFYYDHIIKMTKSGLNFLFYFCFDLFFIFLFLEL